jgi:hypothetical protein
VRCVLEEQVFQGEGRKKADAKRDAAANALAFLQQQPLWEAQHRLSPLQDVLNACFTQKVQCFMDGTLHGVRVHVYDHEYLGMYVCMCLRTIAPTACCHTTFCCFTPVAEHGLEHFADAFHCAPPSSTILAF